MQQSHQVSLMGREFRVKSDDDGTHLQQAASYVNELVAELQGSRRHVPRENLLLLASLSMADELMRERARTEAIKEKIRAQSRALLSRLGQ